MQTQPQFLTLRTHLQQIIVGQHALLDRLMIALLSGGHVLLEGLPGLAKTTAVNALAGGVHAGFQRIQFTPDLMPGDLTGTDVFDPEQHAFRFVAGPLFHEIVPPRPLSLGMAARLLLAALLLGVLLWSVPRLWRCGVALWRCHRERRAALIALSHAEDTAAMRAALRRYAAADGSSGNITLRHWWQRHGGSLPAETMGDLAAASYGGRRDVDLQALRRALLSHRLR